MGREKPPWKKSNLPKNIKIKIWDIMSQTNTYPNMCKHLANYPDSLTDHEWEQLGTTKEAIKESIDIMKAVITRDVYKALQEEIMLMPLRNLAFLHIMIQNFGRALRGDTQLQQSIESLIQLQEEHPKELARVAEKLVDFLKYVRQTSSNWNWTLIEFATERNAKPEFIAILEDFHTKCLLTHMQAEKPVLAQLASLRLWDDLKRRNINDALIDRLSLKAERKDFIGKCEICKYW